MRVDEGRFTAAEAVEIRALGAEIGAMLDAVQQWWDPAWSRWEPEPGWAVPAPGRRLGDASLRREPQVQPPQRPRRPPVPVAEQRHQARNEQRADDRRVERDGHRGADAELLDERDPGGRERADRDAEEQRGGGDDPPRPLHPVRDGVAVLEPAVARLLDPGEEEDRVVGREAEGGRAEQDRLGRLEAREPASPLEHDHEDPERGAEREDVHEQRLERQHDRAREEEDQRARREGEDRERPRQVRGERCLLVDERRRLPGDAGRRAAPRAPCGRAAASCRRDPRRAGGCRAARGRVRSRRAGSTAAAPGCRRELARPPLLAGGAAVIAVIGRVAAADVLPVERLGDLARARGGGQRRRVDADEVNAERRDREHDQAPRPRRPPPGRAAASPTPRAAPSGRPRAPAAGAAARARRSAARASRGTPAAERARRGRPPARRARRRRPSSRGTAAGRRAGRPSRPRR